MISEFAHKGIWWLPDNEDVKIEGTLYFNPKEDPKLELTGSFTGIEDIMKVSRWDIVLGFTVTGKEVTLLNCISGGTKLHMPGIPTSDIFPDIVFLGSNFPSADQIIFESLYVRYSLLDEWLGVHGFDIKRNFDRKETVISYKLPETIEAKIDDDLSIGLAFNATSPVLATTEAKIQQTSKFHIKPSASQNFDFFQGINRYLHNLLSLATLRRIHPIYMQGVTSEGLTDIYYKNIFYLPGADSIKTPFDLLFSYGHVKDRFDDFLRRWFEISGLFEPVLNLYFGIIHSHRMYMEHRFLSLCQAIEAYHRRVSPGVYQAKDEFMKDIYPALIGAIPEGTEKNYRESIKARLKYLNEYSLRKRLKEIIETHEKVLVTLIPIPKSIISSIVDTRNFFTHYDDDLKESSLEGEDLYLAAERLKFMIEVCFLFQLRFSDEEMIALINRTQRYNYLKQKNPPK
ncbi:HEPN domain-containing protein [Thermodesulfobacteriota bacterium]